MGTNPDINWTPEQRAMLLTINSWLYDLAVALQGEERSMPPSLAHWKTRLRRDADILTYGIKARYSDLHDPLEESGTHLTSKDVAFIEGLIALYVLNATVEAETGHSVLRVPFLGWGNGEEVLMRAFDVAVGDRREHASAPVESGALSSLAARSRVVDGMYPMAPKYRAMVKGYVRACDDYGVNGTREDRTMLLQAALDAIDEDEA